MYIPSTKSIWIHWTCAGKLKMLPSVRHLGMNSALPIIRSSPTTGGLVRRLPRCHDSSQRRVQPAAELRQPRQLLSLCAPCTARPPCTCTRVGVLERRDLTSVDARSAGCGVFADFAPRTWAWGVRAWTCGFRAWTGILGCSDDTRERGRWDVKDEERRKHDGIRCTHFHGCMMPRRCNKAR